MQTVYVDTSVFGGCYDEEFQEWSNALMEEFRQGLKKAVISDVTLDELENAPEKVQQVLIRLPEESRMFVPMTDEAIHLANQYIEEQAVTMKFYEDALHIAIATVSHVSVLVSWNFKHIVNIERIRRYNAVNLRNGYSLL